jgi:hypothetical protein
MATAPRISLPRRDGYADLEFIESLLAQALLLQRRSSKDTQARLSSLEALCSSSQEAVSQLGSKLTSLREEAFGQPYVKLRELLHQDMEDTRGRRMEISRLINGYVRNREQVELWQDNQAITLDCWVGGAEHSKRRRQLIDLLISVRAGIWESVKTLANPDDPEGSADEPALWSETHEGQVQVRFRGLFRTIAEQRLARLFVAVAKDKGQLVPWEELIRRLMVSEGDASVLSVETIRTYSRQVRDQLNPFGDLWEQEKDGVRWAGADPRGS